MLREREAACVCVRACVCVCVEGKRLDWEQGGRSKQQLSQKMTPSQREHNRGNKTRLINT